MLVSNYDYSTNDFATENVVPVGNMDGDYACDAAEILGLEYDDEEPSAWADIYINRYTGKQYAVCGTGEVTSHDNKFYFLQTEYADYLPSDKYEDLFGEKADEAIEYLNPSDFNIYDTVNERTVTADEVRDKGMNTDHLEIACKRNLTEVAQDRTHNVLSSDRAFAAFSEACDNIKIAAYLAGARYMYDFGDTVIYYKKAN